MVHSVEAEFGVPTYLKLLPSMATLTGGVLAYLVYSYPQGGWGQA